MCRPSHGLFSRPEAGSRRQLHRAAQREQGAAHLLMTCGFCSCALFSMSCRASLRMYCCAATVFSSDLSGSLTRRGQSRAIFSARRYVASTATRCAADMTRALRERATWFSANSRALAVRHRELNRTRRARQAHTLGSALPGRGGEEHPRCFPAPAARSLCSPPKAQLSLSVSEAAHELPHHGVRRAAGARDGARRDAFGGGAGRPMEVRGLRHRRRAVACARTHACSALRASAPEHTRGNAHSAGPLGRSSAAITTAPGASADAHRQHTCVHPCPGPRGSAGCCISQKFVHFPQSACLCAADWDEAGQGRARAQLALRASAE